MQGSSQASDSGRGRRSWRHVLGVRPLSMVLALLLGGGLTLAAVGATGERPSRVVYDVLGGQDVRLTVPGTDDPRGVAIFFHGQTGGVDNRMDDPWLQSLVRAGWIVASSDFHTASWGNEASTEDTRLLAQWATEQTGEPVRLFVSGSMGATVSLNAMIQGVAPPACWYGVKPAIDITKMSNVPGGSGIIRAAYGGKPVPSERNPAEQLDRLPLETRYRMVSSYEDPWVLRTENTDRLVRNLENRGGDVSVLTVTGIHDDPTHFDNRDLVDFAETCAD